MEHNNTNHLQHNNGNPIARARWAILRTAILGPKQPNQQPESDVSIHRFAGFRLLHRTILKDGMLYYRDRLLTNGIIMVLASREETKDLGNDILERVMNVSRAIRCLPGRRRRGGEDDSSETITVKIVVKEESAVSMVMDVIDELRARGLVAELSISEQCSMESDDEVKHNNRSYSTECSQQPIDHPQSDLPENSRRIITLQVPLTKILTQTNDSPIYECIEYTFHDSFHPIRILTRERRRTTIPTKLDLKALTSQRHYGVDNTSNTCVWDSESVLTHCLLRRQTTSSSIPNFHFILSLASPNKVLRVIELGAGMAGLAGLALASCTTSKVQIDVTLTDGHIDAVRNNAVCAALTSSLHPNQHHLRTCHLRWKDNDDGAAECHALTSKHPFRLCLVSDCLHFRDCHAALFATMGRLLDVGGYAVLCQPRRGRSLEEFMALVGFVNDCGKKLVDVELWEVYDEEVTRRHERFVRDGEMGYEVDKHYPLMLVLKKTREYKEGKDTMAAREFVRERDKC